MLHRASDLSKGRSSHRWNDNIKMDVNEIGWESVIWIHLVQDRNHSIKWLEFLEQLSDHYIFNGSALWSNIISNTANVDYRPLGKAGSYILRTFP
jgi:hypothetical protein